MSPKVYRLFQILIVAAIILLNIVFLRRVPFYGISNPIYLFFSITYVFVLLLAAFLSGKNKVFFVLILVYWGILFLSFVGICCTNIEIIRALALFPYFYLAHPLYGILSKCELLPYHLGSILFFVLVYGLIVISYMLGRRLIRVKMSGSKKQEFA